MTNKNLKSNRESPLEVLNEIFRLNIKIRKLENGIEGYLGNGRNICSDILNKCLTETREYVTLRVTDCDKLRKRLVEIKRKIKNLKKSIENIEPNDEHVAGVKMEMEEIEGLISELKHEQKDNYESLLRSELTLWQEVLFMEKKIDSWESGEHEDNSGQISKVSKRSEIISPKDVTNQPVLALQKFLDENGGKIGGWSTIDHQTFLRIRLRYTRINVKDEISYPRDEGIFFTDLSSLLAPKTIAEVEAHELWYQKYQELVLEKKKFIAKWKEDKSKQEVKDDIVELDETQVISGRSNWEKEKKRLEKQRQELDAWRTSKALEEFNIKMKKEKTLKDEMERKRKEEEKQRAEMRRQVESYKQKKIGEDAEKYEIQLRLKEYEENEKKKILEQHSARISERNTRMVEERILKKHQKKIDEELKEERLNQLRSKVAITVPRDPSRLLRPTTGWTQKLADMDENRGPPISGAMRINNVQHKAVPSWRQNIP